MSVKLAKVTHDWDRTVGWAAMAILALLFFRPGLYVEVVDDPDLVITTLRFEDGHFLQIVEPDQFGAAIRGDWAAKIETAEGGFVCGGGGRSSYQRRTQPLVMTPDEWTGGDCSELVEGEQYTAKASWEYFNSRGLLQRRHADFNFVYEDAD